MEYRLAKESDLSAIQLLARETIDKCYRPFLGDEAVDWYLSSGESDKEVANNFSNCVVAEGQGSLIGYCVVQEAFIYILMVSPNVQRLGHGSLFLSHLETKMVNSGYKVLKLETFKNNQQAVNFYLKNGWKIVNEETDAEFGFVRVYLEKQVTNRQPCNARQS